MVTLTGYDAWLTIPQDDTDGVEHDEDCRNADVRDYMCGCLECVECGAETQCAGCYRADAAGL